jgi:dUTP pyrophosphatase
MQPLKVYFKNKKAQLTKGSPKSAGLDVVYCGEEDIKLNPTMRALLPTGIHMVIPDGYEMQVRPRSGLALKHGLTVLNSPGTIDSDFRGEVGVILVNTSCKAVIIKPGSRIAQLVFNKIEDPVIIPISKEELEEEETENGLTVFNSPGTINSDFRKAVIIKPGRRKNSKKKKLKEEMGDSDQQENNAGTI